MQPRSATHKWAATAFAAALAVSGLAACGSSGSSATKAKSDTTSAPTTTAGTQSVDTACQAWLSTDEAVAKGPESSGEAPPTPAQLKAFATMLQPNVGKFADAAPAKISKSVTALSAIVDNAAKGQGLADFDPSGPKLGEPLTAIEGWVHTSCGFTSLDVMGKNYSFSGIADKVKAGPTSIKFMNMAKDEQHEAVLLKINPGASFTAKDLAAALKKDSNAAEQQYGKDVAPAGNVSAAPGQTSYVTVDLTPGEYVAACFVGADSGKPHAQLGMVTPFTVE